ncbi:phosphatase PAP2 family protein [Ferruginibacter sp.]|nr:phosphatase PAP2 family protein [Ferruginibacter sp.]
MNRFSTIIFFLLLQSNLHAQNFDINLLKSINKNETNFKNKYLELNASSVTVLSVGIPAGIAIAGFINHDKKLQRDALYMGGAFIVTGIITQSTKRIIDRQRPFEKYSFIIKRDDESGGLSFPSGHTSSAFSTATSVALRYRKWYFVAPSYLFASSVAWARMYQGVHYPSDVFAGALIGTGSAWLGWKVQKFIEKKQHKAISTNKL